MMKMWQKWQGKIALPTVSEYLRTNSNTNCKTFITYNNNYNTCKNTTWMFNNSNWCGPCQLFDGNTLDVYYISANGNFPLLGNTAYLYAGERPHFISFIRYQNNWVETAPNLTHTKFQCN